VTKAYGAGDTKTWALRGIDLDVCQGELLMVAGPSGCGKTTLISIIAAILDQDEGQCQVLGHDVKDMDRTERVRFRGRSIGFVFQAFNLLPALTAHENVAVPLLLNGVTRKHALNKARDVLESLDLGARSVYLPAQLSGGQQQRVAIARALVHEPQLIICDEPTSNLDHQSGQDTMTILRGVAQSTHRSLIVVTHDNRILAYADRIANMDDGKIVSITGGRSGKLTQ
jgi:putative ABC transport system ATP-binding protein